MNRPKRTKKDTNHAEIVRELRQLGAVVWDTADLGGHILDLVVHWRGQTRVVEVKPPGPMTFTDGEYESFDELGAVGVVGVIAQSMEDVVSAFLGDLAFTDLEEE